MSVGEMSFSDPRIKRLVQAAYPGARSRRTVKLESRTTYEVRDYWDGGSRDECRFVDLSNMAMKHSESVPREKRQQAGNPFGLAIYEVNLAPGFVVVEHVIFCGKDMGYRVYYHPDLKVSSTETLLALPLHCTECGKEGVAIPKQPCPHA
jgi:hypothetical protein